MVQPSATVFMGAVVSLSTRKLSSGSGRWPHQRELWASSQFIDLKQACNVLYQLFGFGSLNLPHEVSVASA